MKRRVKRILTPTTSVSPLSPWINSVAFFAFPKVLEAAGTISSRDCERIVMILIRCLLIDYDADLVYFLIVTFVSQTRFLFSS